MSNNDNQQDPRRYEHEELQKMSRDEVDQALEAGKDRMLEKGWQYALEANDTAAKAVLIQAIAATLRDGVEQVDAGEVMHLALVDDPNNDKIMVLGVASRPAAKILNHILKHLDGQDEEYLERAADGMDLIDRLVGMGQDPGKMMDDLIGRILDEGGQKRQDGPDAQQ